MVKWSLYIDFCLQHLNQTMHFVHAFKASASHDFSTYEVLCIILNAGFWGI